MKNSQKESSQSGRIEWESSWDKYAAVFIVEKKYILKFLDMVRATFDVSECDFWQEEILEYCYAMVIHYPMTLQDIAKQVKNVWIVTHLIRSAGGKVELPDPISFFKALKNEFRENQKNSKG